MDEVGYALVDRNQVNVDPVAAHADALLAATGEMQVGQCMLVGALPGQTAVIRYPRVPDMPVDQISEWVEAEAGQNIPYDLSEVYLDSAPLETVTEGDEKMLRVLLVAAKHSAIESRLSIVEAADLTYGVLTVDSLALADAAESCEFLRVGESAALVNIGLTSVSIHFTRDGISRFIRDVNWGGRELIQAIARAKRCEYEEAEKTLYQIGETQDEAAFGVRPVSAEPEEALVGEEKPVEPFGSPLDPLDEELAGADTASDRGVPEEVSGELSPPELEEALRQPLGQLVSEIRRSFEYYEQQLFEPPVDKMILSGGVAHLRVMRESLLRDLEVGLEVADPSNSALGFGDGPGIENLRKHPAQYMVAVGLAARGMAEL